MNNSEAQRELIAGKTNAICELLREAIIEIAKKEIKVYIKSNTDDRDCLVASTPKELKDRVDAESLSVSILNAAIDADRYDGSTLNSFTYSFFKRGKIREIVGSSFSVDSFIDEIKEKLNYKEDDVFSAFDFYEVKAGTQYGYTSFDINREKFEEEFDSTKKEFCNILNSLDIIKNNNSKFFIVEQINGNNRIIKTVIFAIRSTVNVYKIDLKNTILNLFKETPVMNNLSLKISDTDLISLHCSYYRLNKKSDTFLFLEIKEQQLNTIQARVLESAIELVANILAIFGYKLRASKTNPRILEVTPEEDTKTSLESIVNKIINKKEEK